MSNTTVASLLRETTNALGTLEQPRTEAMLLLGHTLAQSRAWLIANDDAMVSCNQQKRLKTLISDRLAGKPLAYITGRRAFWEGDFVVTEDTLIPRPETELLVEAVLAMHDATPRQVLDLGTGSGCIAVSLACERPGWHVIAADLSPGAISVAKQNGSNQQNLSYVNSNWAASFADKSLDTIVCNPPYIRPNDPHLPDLTFEPISALVSSHNGLQDIKRVAADARRCLKDSGTLFMEHGYDQQADVCAILSAQGFTTETRRDLGNQPRLVIAQLEDAS